APPPAAPPSASPPSVSPPPSVQPPSTPLTLTGPGLVGTASLARVERLAAVLRHGLRVRLSCSVTCTMRVTLSLPGAHSAAAGKTTVSLDAGSHREVRIRLSSSVRRRLLRRRGGLVVVRLNAAAGSRRWRSFRSVLVRQ